MINKWVWHFSAKQLLLTLIATGAIAYISLCLYLFWQQRHFVFEPSDRIDLLPSAPDFQLPYQNIQIPVGNHGDRLHAWWIPAPTPHEKFSTLPNEPVRILKSPKTILYLCGRAGNKTYYNYITRIKALRQLGFDVLVIDYRGYGLSGGMLPSEAQIYEDSQAAWTYLTQIRGIVPDQIVVYGESLGGAVALDLVAKHPEVGGAIIQSSFTKMAEVIKLKELLWLLPIDLILTERFDSLSKVRSLNTSNNAAKAKSPQIPILFIHGTADDVVPVNMSQQLYDAAPEPKQLLLIPDAGHYRIYQPGANSYLRAIQKFIEQAESAKNLSSWLKAKVS
jgi:uncharacterized protein